MKSSKMRKSTVSSLEDENFKTIVKIDNKFTNKKDSIDVNRSATIKEVYRMYAPSDKYIPQSLSKFYSESARDVLATNFELLLQLRTDT